MQTHYDYDKAIEWLCQRGKENYGGHFTILDSDRELIIKLICYFLKDEPKMKHYEINPNKGILLNGPIGCGKTSLMSLMRFYEPANQRFNIKSCRDISFDFIQSGYDAIHRYSRRSFEQHNPLTWCFDDLGTESNLKYYGNECNVMAEVLLSRYDLFVSRKLLTHLTTNLSASEIEEQYGNRVRSRLREMFNLIAFDKTTRDKRK
ncbi:MAG: cell division protein ZapE [Bacteroidia bacterium]|nr:cell division protein ZapE [Bacteroidia bacterium]